MPDLDLISTDEACEILGVTARSSITRMVTRGELTPAHNGRVLLFQRADVLRLRDERREKGK